MSKAVMMSIQPKWVEKILNGEKTIEVRKTAPKLETPFKVYIYCTKGGKKDIIVPMRNNRFTGDILNGKVVAEFTCDKIDCAEPYYNYLARDVDRHYLNGKKDYPISVLKLKKTCLTRQEIVDYGNEQSLYLWHISNLKIYDKPRELGDFVKPTNDIAVCDRCDNCEYSGKDGLERGCYCHINLTKPPQSWGYVEEIK